MLSMGNRTSLADCLSVLTILILHIGFALPTFAPHEERDHVWMHVTDVHVDTLYLNGSDPNLPLGETCHYIHANQTRSAGMYGDYNCDTSPRLFSSLISFLQSSAQRHSHQSPALFWTGDSGPHLLWSELTEEKVKHSVSHVWSSLLTVGVPVWPSLGNHDVFPEDQSPPDSCAYYQWLTDLWVPRMRFWSALEATTAAATIGRGAYYSVRLNEKVQLISLNTILWSSANLLVNTSGSLIDDPGDQFSWLTTALSAVALEGRKAVLLGHICPGVNAWNSGRGGMYEVYNRRLYETLRAFHGVIVGVLCGHEHTDTFRLVRSDSSPDGWNSTALGVVTLAPSVTPWRNLWVPDAMGNNPAVRCWKYSAAAEELVEYEQLYANLTAANKDVDGPQWVREYKSSSLMPGNLSPASFSSYLTAIVESPSLFLEYYARNVVQYEPRNSCTPEKPSRCFLSQICSMSSVHIPHYEECLRVLQSALEGHAKIRQRIVRN